MTASPLFFFSLIFSIPFLTYPQSDPVIFGNHGIWGMWGTGYKETEREREREWWWYKNIGNGSGFTKKTNICWKFLSPNFVCFSLLWLLFLFCSFQFYNQITMSTDAGFPAIHLLMSSSDWEERRMGFSLEFNRSSTPAPNIMLRIP